MREEWNGHGSCWRFIGYVRYLVYFSFDNTMHHFSRVALGYDSTNPITIEDMMHHSRAVARACKSCFLVGDMPFGTYEFSTEHAVKNAIRFLKEGRMEAVKLEGGVEMAPTIKRITSVGVPVLGHIGLTPQRASSLSGFKAQGRTVEKVRSHLFTLKTLCDLIRLNY